MSKSNSELLSLSRASLNGKWGLAIGTILLLGILEVAAGSIPFLSLILGGPFTLGAAIFSLNISREREAKLDDIFQGFQNFSNALVTYLLMVLYIFLWSLLLIIPGIIAGLGYSLVFYIIADEPDIKPSDALNKSKQMMDGYKMKMFTLCLRFFLLGILCVLTLFIGLLWLIPYVHITMAKFYDDVRNAPAQVV
ncbi:MAG: DUF975 family protein [Flavobacteriales bacterium]|nr:DUF975 family protein [Flavobacteriales bacterium]MCB9448363.1 DUF975 family protein [Flavobacteriales bacterium]